MAFFPHVLIVSYLQIQQTKNFWIIKISLNYFVAIFKVSRLVAFKTETRPEIFDTETRKNGSRDESWDRDEISRLHHWLAKHQTSDISLKTSVATLLGSVVFSFPNSSVQDPDFGFYSTVAIGKTRVACVQSLALWQQPTIEFTRQDHSIIACSNHVYILLFFAHIPFVMNHTFNTTPPERL